jgi:hypothetical protein
MVRRPKEFAKFKIKDFVRRKRNLRNVADMLEPLSTADRNAWETST